MTTVTKANERQVGGSHYKAAVQHWDFVLANGLGYLEGQITKYVSRWRRKGGMEDLQKARHFLDKLIEWESEGAHMGWLAKKGGGWACRACGTVVMDREGREAYVCPVMVEPVQRVLSVTCSGCGTTVPMDEWGTHAGICAELQGVRRRVTCTGCGAEFWLAEAATHSCGKDYAGH